MSTTAVVPAPKQSFLQKFEADMKKAGPVLLEYFPEILEEAVSVITAVKSGSSKVQDAEIAAKGAADVAALIDPAAAPLAAAADTIFNAGVTGVQSVVNAAEGKAVPAPEPGLTS
jgi:hypothetical protein